MFIQTQATADPARLAFLPGCVVLTSGSALFADPNAAARSPLAGRLFEVDGVTAVELDAEAITLSKADDRDWQVLKPAILGAIMEHFSTGQPVMLDPAPETATGTAPIGDGDADPDTIAQIKALIETRIKPAAVQGGGDIAYRGFKGGIVYLEMAGSGYGLLPAVGNLLRHYVPDVEGAADHRDAMPKPGLETADGKAIRELLDRNINPQVAGHGGHISLVDVRDDTVYVRLEGGCQGCGMADVTLKQGVATEIQARVPAIRRVLDVTDHAGGTNPYYQPGKGGAGAL